jgi:hypothetical protein
MGSRQLKIMNRAIFKIVLCMRSALPFDAGLSASVRWRAIPLRSQNKSSFVCVFAPTIGPQYLHTAVETALKVANKV